MKGEECICQKGGVMYLSKRGYVVNKAEIGQIELTELKSTLRGRPLQDVNYNQVPVAFPLYIETKNKIYIPKMYGISKYGYPKVLLDNFNVQRSETFGDFKGDLFPVQREAADVMLQTLGTTGGGILSLGTGLGKTVTALYILSQLKVKTLIIVNKIPLMRQWEEEIKQFIPGGSVGFLQGSKNVSVESKDIVIGMLQSLAKIDYPPEIFNDFGALVVDETHNIASKVFSQVLLKVCCKYTIGLTATPSRSDGCEYVFKWFLGEVVYQTKLERAGMAPILRIVKLKSKDYREITNPKNNKIQFTAMLSELVEMPKRNGFIVETIKELVGSKRKVLVMSDRRDHLKHIKGMLDTDPEVQFSHGLFIGQMKMAELEANKTCDVILATFSAFSEGVSIKDLNTLFLITPKKYIGHIKTSSKQESGKMEQIVGRIFRKDHLEMAPLIVDLFDEFSVYRSQSNGRKVFYKTYLKDLKMKIDQVDLDTNCTSSHIETERIQQECLLID
ncbi:DEAD/DEAH box helicase [bacterium]|nr:DEAD/DEAH box helicase [bacterium]